MPRESKPWFEALNEIPPGRLRLFARKGDKFHQKMKTRADIARDGGLAESTVSKIVGMKDWNGLLFETIVRYIKGCGVDPLDLGEHRRFFQRQDRKRAYLKRMTVGQRKMVKKVLDLNKG
jgi:hypothetical protein